MFLIFVMFCMRHLVELTLQLLETEKFRSKFFSTAD